MGFTRKHFYPCKKHSANCFALGLTICNAAVKFHFFLRKLGSDFIITV